MGQDWRLSSAVVVEQPEPFGGAGITAEPAVTEVAAGGSLQPPGPNGQLVDRAAYGLTKPALAGSGDRHDVADHLADPAVLGNDLAALIDGTGVDDDQPVRRAALQRQGVQALAQPRRPVMDDEHPRDIDRPISRTHHTRLAGRGVFAGGRLAAGHRARRGEGHQIREQSRGAAEAARPHAS